jgi:hypothetical protein
MQDDPRRSVIFGATRGGFGLQNAFWSSMDSPVKLITYPEVKFIEAEARQRLGTGNADAALAEAVRANFAELGIGGQAYDPGTANLGNIIREKYKALYPQHQAWVDYRRTGFPNITPNPVIEQGLNPSQVIPRRFIYPVDEINYNTENVIEARERQGGDLLDVSLWAFE